MITDAYARRDDLQTSHDAAASVRPTRLEQLVFDALSALPLRRDTDRESSESRRDDEEGWR